MRACVVTIFPDLIRGFLDHGLIKRARENGVLDVSVVDLRDHAHDRHSCVDDAPFGGGGGMVMRPEPLFEAVAAHRREGEKVLLMSPQGTPLNHALAARLAVLPGVLMICGRYEGVDERVREALVDEEISIGDYVLMGGEMPALVVLEAVARLVPGVLGNEESSGRDSFVRGLLDFPHYTRPQEFHGMRVPEVLVSGDHGAVERWRRRESLRQTLSKRPDLLASAPLDREDAAILDELRKEKSLPVRADQGGLT
jgi:tRNA (guanine37-N1)-methyltransferase